MPASHDGAPPTDLTELGAELLADARAQESGRSATSLVAGPGTPLKQVLLALSAGSVLQDHRAPGPATLQVLEGRVALTWDGERQILRAGQWAPIPNAVHGLAAEQDSVAVLTVGLGTMTPTPSSTL